MSMSDDWDRLLAELASELARRRTTGASTPAGDEAWEELGRRVRRIGRFFVTRDDLDDLVQDVLTKLQSTEVLRRLRAARAPAGYLAVMVRHAATDLIRRQAAPSGATQRIEEGVGDLSAVLEGLDREKRVAVLRQVVARLSDGDRLLLRLRFWEEMSMADIARRLGVPYSTIAVRLFRMLRRLRVELESTGGEP
jgi:RNA polymerase sigma factor (sigma-70 family)